MLKRKTKTAKAAKPKNGVVPKVTLSGTPLDVASTGRPPKFNAEIAEIAKRCISQFVMTDEEVCLVLGIGRTTWYNWLNKYEQFREATVRAKETANKVVESALLKRATGYSVDAVKIFMTTEVTETATKRGGRKIVRKQRPVRVSYQEHIAPDVDAISKWLDNRNPERWHRKAANEPPPTLPAGEEEARRESWRKLIALIKQNAADGGQPFFATNALPAPEQAQDVTPSLAAGGKK